MEREMAVEECLSPIKIICSDRKPINRPGMGWGVEGGGGGGGGYGCAAVREPCSFAKEV